MVSIRLRIDPRHIILRQGRKLTAIGDLAANIEAGQGPVNCSGSATMLIGLLLTKQLFTALIEDFLQTLLIVMWILIVLI